MHLYIKPANDSVREMYANHGSYHHGDSGLDLFVPETMTIPARSMTMINLAIACETLDNESYLLLPRSSICKTPLRLANSIGLIDAGYRGTIQAAVDNISDEDYVVEKGVRLFQLAPIDGKRGVSFRLVAKLSETTRGTGGHGSTGK
jgi:dUTP pyrophosphatase